VGLLSFITNYIPNIGFVLGLISPALLGLLEGGPWLLLWVIVGYTGRREVTQAPDAERKATAKFLAIFRSTLTLDGKDRSCHRNML
jgi:hypothetical protein